MSESIPNPNEPQLPLDPEWDIPEAIATQDTKLIFAEAVFDITSRKPILEGESNRDNWRRFRLPSHPFFTCLIGTDQALTDRGEGEDCFVMVSEESFTPAGEKIFTDISFTLSPNGDFIRTTEFTNPEEDKRTHERLEEGRISFELKTEEEKQTIRAGAGQRIAHALNEFFLTYDLEDKFGQISELEAFGLLRLLQMVDLYGVEINDQE